MQKRTATPSKKSLRPVLKNKESARLLRERAKEAREPRTTLSFYRYVAIENPKAFRDALYITWHALGVFGRIYIAKEGINAQLSVPTKNFDQFKESLENRSELSAMPLKIAVEDGLSFYKLTIKVKQNIVADGLPAGTYDTSKVGTHLTPEEFNAALEDPNAVVVDVRNHYESRIGHFEGALLPDADTFRDELPLIHEMLKDKKDKKILLYCTGGIRCEKASSYLKHSGFNDVNQLYGGIINYAHEVKKKGLTSKFKGRNYVFDDRNAERITSDILSECDQCSQLADSFTNCANEYCNLLFIQCESCAKKFEGCCSTACIEIKNLTPEERKKRGLKPPEKSYEVYISRLRPKLK